MENGSLVTHRDSNNQMQRVSNNNRDKKEGSKYESERKQSESENLNHGNGLGLILDDVDGSGRNKGTNKVVDKALLGAEYAFESPKQTNLTSDQLSELKLSVQTLESSNQSFECQPKPLPDPHEEYNKKRKRLILRAVVLLCLAGALQGILVNGLINVVISSIEKRLVTPCLLQHYYCSLEEASIM